MIFLLDVVKVLFISSWVSNYGILFNCGLRPIEIFNLLKSLLGKEGDYSPKERISINKHRRGGLCH